MAEITKQALKVDNNQSFPNNNNGAITPSILRAFNTNMIDSMVDELSYNVDSASWNSSISQLNVFTASAAGLNTGSLLVTASAVSNVITFTKGNGTTFNVTVADTTDLSSLNAFTASAQVSLNNLNLWTSSYQPIITNLQASQSIDATKFTTIGTQSGSWDNTSLNSYTASNDTKWNTLGSLSGSFVTESETGSFARTNTTNTFTSANTFTSISASSFVSASAFVGDGSKITGITASIALPILDEGIPQGNAFSMNFTGSAISAIVVGGTAVVSVNAISTASLNALTQSFNDYTSSTDAKFVAVGASTSSLNSFTASQDTKNSTLATYTASVDSQLSSLTNATASYAISSSVAAVDASQQSQINSLIAATGSYITTPLTSLNSFTASQDTKNSTLATYTASVNSSLTNINTFTASNGNTSLNSYTASNDTKWSNLAGQTGSYVTSTITASSLVTASAVGNTITFTKGDASTFNVSVVATPIDTGSFATTASFNAYTSSNNQRISSLETNSASVNISISNINSATASLFTSASLALVTASFSGNTLTFTKGDTTTFGVVIPDVSGSTINTASFATTGSNIFRGDQIISGTQNHLITSIDNGTQLMFGGSENGQAFDMRVTSSFATQQQTWLIENQGGVWGNAFFGRMYVDSNLNVNQTLTASLQQGYAWVGNSSGKTTTVPTSSFGGALPTGIISGSSQITALGFVSSSVTASSLVTASASGNTITFTKGNSSTFSVSVDTGSATTTIYDTVYTGESITKGDPLYISGAQGANPIVFKADASNPAKMPVTYVSNETIGAGTTTEAIILGHIEGINLTGYTAGQAIYVAEGGGWSASLPSGSNSITQLLGVITKGGSGGKGLVLNPGPAQLPGLDTGKMWVGNGNNQPTEITTASFASSASFNSYTASNDSKVNSLINATASYATSAITASSLVTASVNLNTITFTKGDASTFALTVNTGSGGGGGAAFPFTGDAVITGSLGISGSMFGGVITLSVVSTTASVDFSAGNMFTLTLPSASTHIIPTNIRAGQTVNIQITQPTPGTGSVTFSPLVLFAGGNDYQATATGSAVDMLTLVSYDGTNALATSIKNFL